MSLSIFNNRRFLRPTLIAGSVVAILLVAGIVFINHTSTTSAAISNWNAGRIIDDAVFTNKSSMNVEQIQQFLNSKVPTCDTMGTKPSEYGGGTRRQWAESKGYSVPFTCLKDFSENGKSAAQIIYDASQDYTINPQVLIVLLQKEQGLVTDTWPLSKQYRAATGYGCPDTAPCNAEYYGLTNQVRWSAKMFNAIVTNNPNWYTPKKLGNSYIQWNPTASCGGSTVNIENRSTQALYNYTPYQPNQSALNAGYGTGDGCGAYGNRNFYLYFTDWFGTTYTDAYNAQFNAQSPLSEPFYPGESRAVYLQYKNNGSTRWFDSASAPAGVTPVHLAASVPTNRGSVFSYGWPSDGRPNFNFTRVYEANGTTLAANQHVVEPGQIARFEFNITPPRNIDLGTHREYFQPVLEGATSWNMGGVAWLDINVASRYSATYSSQSAYPKLTKNSSVSDNFISYKNTGSAAWYDNMSTPAGYYPTQLATTAPNGRTTQLGVDWPSNQVASITFSAVYEANGVTLAGNQHIVMPGQIGKFNFKLGASANTEDSFIREYLQPIIAGSPHPYMGGISWIDATIDNTATSLQFAGQSLTPSITRGQSAPVYMQYKNIGTNRLYDDVSVPGGFSPLHFAASAPTNRGSAFSYGWPSNGRPNFNFSKVFESDGTTLAANQHIVESGQIVRFEFNITAPWNVNFGTHREHFQPVLEGAKDWNIGGLGWFDVTVR